MLRIKYFSSFKNNHPFLVVIATKDGLRRAYEYFGNSKGAYLNDPEVTEFCNIAPLTRDHLFLSSEECAAIAQHFKDLYDLGAPRHAYFDTVALGDQIEMIISIGEYEGLF